MMPRETVQKINLRDALKLGEDLLRENGIEDAAVDAWLLLEYVTGMSRTVFLAESGQEMSKDDYARYHELLVKRGGHIPLQHLTGEQAFMGLPFRVNEHVLIPRQDTEVLAEEALKRLRPGMRVLDMCTGSGCIAVSLVKLFSAGRPDAIKVEAADISEKALEVASENALRLGADVKFIRSDLFSQVSDTYDMIVSNPPYIRSDVIKELSEEVRCHEPYQALDGKEDGLYYYRRIIRESPGYLQKEGWLLFEIGYDQAKQVTALMEQAGFVQIMTVRDLAGLDRVVLGQSSCGMCSSQHGEKTDNTENMPCPEKKV